jgi:uncharacterized GH25 family protein
MTRYLLAAAAAVLAAAGASAHFVFVVPAADGAAAAVVFSDSLDPDDGVEIGKIAGLKLTVRDAAGKDAPLAHTTGKDALNVALPGAGPRVVFGGIVYGVSQRGDAKPFLLTYHPKAVVGGAGEAAATLGAASPAELVPVAAGGKVRFKLLAAGKPVADAEVNLLKPDGSKAKVKTDGQGLTPAVDGVGRYGAWARVAAAEAGEHGGKKYDEVRRYATLVVDVAK